MSMSIKEEEYASYTTDNQIQGTVRFFDHCVYKVKTKEGKEFIIIARSVYHVTQIMSDGKRDIRSIEELMYIPNGYALVNREISINTLKQESKE